jgi:Transposase DDE domain
MTMPRRFGPVHVATTVRRYKGRLYQTHLLRRTYREGGKVKHETLGNISHLPAPVIELVRRALRGEIPSDAGGFEIRRSLPHGHVAATLGTIRHLGLDTLIASRPCRERTVVIGLIAARVMDPGSKLATARAMNAETASTSLGLDLGLEAVSEDDLYDAMDWLLKRQERIEAKLARRHLHEGTLVLYDVSSSFYTGTHCPLVRFGHNRDGKNGYPQIVYGLLCNAQGCPVAVEVFEGNTSDPMTLDRQIHKVRERFGLQRVVLVGDRGMLTTQRIDTELRPVDGLDWITALRADTVKKLAQQGVIQPSLFDEHDLAEVTSPDYPGERLIVCRNPLWAQERARKRCELLEATEKKLNEIVAATRRARRPLQGRDQIGLRVGRVINHYKVAKHFTLNIEEASFTYRRNEPKIAEEAALDGIYVIRTSVAGEKLGAASTVRAYKDLSKVERAFRSLKTMDLKIRPIHHWIERRVRAHVFLCLLAYYVEWHMRRALAPILFDDEDLEAAQATRASIVAPAPRSPKARRKDRTKATEDHYPVHSFRTVLKDLGTLAKNLVSAAGTHPGEFYLLTQPTELQRRAFELLEVAPFS